MTYWLRLERDTHDGRLEPRFVSIPFTWLWELPLACWKLRKAWLLQERLMTHRGTPVVTYKERS